MTIQRQYSLPNCKLTVEGLADSTATSGGARPVMSVVTNAECQFVGHETVLSGGRDFLESLAIAVSNYAQEFLSGVPHPHHNREGKSSLVSLSRVSSDIHRLTVQSEAPSLEMNGSQVEGRRVASDPVEVDLRTGQLFDLVDAIDQLFADTQTVPNLALQLAPVSKRYAVTHEPMTKQVVPAAVGLASLAAAAIALFFVPIPERRPQAATDPTTQSSPVSSSPLAASPPGPVPGVVPPTPESSAAALASPSAEVASPEASPTTSSTASTSPNPSPLSSALNTTPEITDPEQLNTLKLQLRAKLAEAWTQRPNFKEDLVYQVSAAQNGDILGFRYMNQPAVNYANQTPLLDLQYKPAEQTNPEPVGLFRVVFTPGGVIQVSPWHGLPEPSP